MEAKEKAFQLTCKFAKIEPYIISKDKGLFIYEAKQYAIICVDEILASNPHSNPLNTDPIFSTLEYWQEVKYQITLL